MWLIIIERENNGCEIWVFDVRANWDDFIDCQRKHNIIKLSLTIFIANELIHCFIDGAHFPNFQFSFSSKFDETLRMPIAIDGKSNTRESEAMEWRTNGDKVHRYHSKVFFFFFLEKFAMKAAVKTLKKRHKFCRRKVESILLLCRCWKLELKSNSFSCWFII